MGGRFAKLEYIKDTNEIPAKFNIVKKQVNLMDWYVKKFNPYKMEEILALSQPGYLIKLPLTLSEAIKDKNKARTILAKTIEALKDLNIEIFLPPKGIPDLLCGLNIKGILAADGFKLFPYFTVKATKKALKTFFNKSQNSDTKRLEDCEFVIISNNSVLLESLMVLLCDEINYLTIVTDNVTEDLARRADEIFYETGLDIRFLEAAKSAVRYADVIINTVYAGTRLDFSFNRKAIYFDLSGNAQYLRELAVNRADMFIADGLKIYNSDIYPISLDEFELGFYAENSDYRQLLRRGCDTDTLIKLQGVIKNMNLKVKGFYFLEKPV